MGTRVPLNLGRAFAATRRGNLNACAYFTGIGRLRSTATAVREVRMIMVMIMMNTTMEIGKE